MDEFVKFALKIERTEGPPKPWNPEAEEQVKMLVATGKEREAAKERMWARYEDAEDGSGGGPKSETVHELHATSSLHCWQHSVGLV